MSKKKEMKPTTKQLEQQCKEYSEALGFDNPIEKKCNAPKCATCGSKEVNMISVCLDCGKHQ
jgi:hypothetical protein